MPGVSNAVFLSYASEDAETAVRIATALRAAGVEVWFDKSELRGGVSRHSRSRKPTLAASDRWRHRSSLTTDFSRNDALCGSKGESSCRQPRILSGCCLGSWSSEFGACCSGHICLSARLPHNHLPRGGLRRTTLSPCSGSTSWIRMANSAWSSPIARDFRAR
jgi:hypothetical protein